MLNYLNDDLQLENVSLAKIAEEIGTPCYVYAVNELRSRFKAFQTGFSSRTHLICYAVKANSNLSILSELQRLGAGFDIVSGGELARCLQIKANPERIVFSGVGKTNQELATALTAGILSFHVESLDELQRLATIALAHHKIASICLRLNPDVDAKTHPYISTGMSEHKFGIALQQLPDCLAIIDAHQASLKLTGLTCHIGSQLISLTPFQEAIQKLLQVWDELAVKYPLNKLGVGGGLGICYRDETPPSIEDYCQAIVNAVGDRTMQLMIEPGRSLIGPAGLLLTQVISIKQHGNKRFAIVDCAMNDLLRPTLYDAWHELLEVQKQNNIAPQLVDVVGPVCESGDWLAKERMLAVVPGSLIAIRDAGAYGFSMSSQYNSRPRAAEVLVDQTDFRLIRRRERNEDLWAHELF